MNIVLLLVGFILLIYGAERFVEFAVKFSKRLNVPTILIGLTVVAFGTSMPEFSVSLISAIENHNDLAVANVVGSNIFNLAAILGVCALVSPIAISKACTTRDLPISLLGAALLVLFGKTVGFLNFWTAGILFICFIGIMALQIRESLKERDNNNAEATENGKPLSLLLISICILLSLGAIVLGGTLVVNSAIDIAHAFNIDERIIGLTIASVGTSLPELVTSVVATIKKQNDIAVGNVVGSNIFNIFFILGFTGMINPMVLSKGSINDSIFLCIITAIFFIPSLKNRLGRIWGGLFLASYIAYIVMSI